MGHCLFMRKGETHTAPISGILLSDIAEGSIVKLNENGSPVEFYVACHNYESALNGEGRTLLVRKDCYDSRVWHSSNVNAYATSDIDSWLNGDYKALLDAKTQSAIGTTKFYYTKGNGQDVVTTLERSVFLLSVTEMRAVADYNNKEGTELNIGTVLQIAYHDESAVDQWTRSPRKDTVDRAYCLYRTSGIVPNYACTDTAYSRPAFTLPSTALFDEETMLLKGVA